ncbi:adenylyl-sulfate kinase, partial [Streptomyces sp. M10]|uniref:adenylyl-sulfate kinase n=1 Tax=Streptomyces sp. M10 TaxID=412968 RepID=UPI0038CF8F5F
MGVRPLGRRSQPRPPGRQLPGHRPPGARAGRFRPMSGARRGATVWLTGLPSAGKSTIATEVAARLRARG